MIKIESKNVDSGSPGSANGIALSAFDQNEIGNLLIIQRKRECLTLTCDRCDIDGQGVVTRRRHRQGDIRMPPDRPSRITSFFRLGAAPTVAEEDVITRSELKRR